MDSCKVMGKGSMDIKSGHVNCYNLHDHIYLKSVSGGPGPCDVISRGRMVSYPSTDLLNRLSIVRTFWPLFILYLFLAIC